MIDLNNCSLEEKCKFFQKRRNYFLDTDKIIIAHLDGRSFSSMIKNKFKKPFDDDFIEMMNETAKYVCKEVQGAQFAYVQSDEITVIIKKNNEKSDIFFGGRMCKMHSILASLATSKFNQLMIAYRIRKEGELSADVVKNLPLYEFDCKVWDVDTPNDAFAWVLFRNIDCTRNSKQQTCQSYLPHDTLKNLTADKQIALLKKEKGIDWNELEAYKKHGRIIKNIDKEYYSNETETLYIRSKWEAFNGVDLTNEKEREKFLDEFDFLKQ